MRITAPITDYIAESVLTTKGDIVKLGAAIAERLGVGNAGDVLTVNSAGDDIEYASGGILTKQEENSQKTGSNITVTTSLTTVSDRALPALTTGERYLVNAIAYGVKTTSGEWRLQLSDALGVNRGRYLHDAASIAVSNYVANGNTGYLMIMGILRANGDGAYTVRLEAQCTAGSLLITTGNAQVYVMKVAGA